MGCLDGRVHGGQVGLGGDSGDGPHDLLDPYRGTLNPSYGLGRFLDCGAAGSGDTDQVRRVLIGPFGGAADRADVREGRFGFGHNASLRGRMAV